MSETVSLNARPQLNLFAGLLVFQAILQLLDLATTYIALQNGATEANPISRMVIEGPGWAVYSGIKIGLAALFLAFWPLGSALEGGQRHFVLGAIGIFGGLMTFVVVNNAMIVF